MSRSKKLFFLLAIAFVGLLTWASYDISTRTTFPGSKPQLRERIKENFEKSQPDSLFEVADSAGQAGD